MLHHTKTTLNTRYLHSRYHGSQINNRKTRCLNGSCSTKLQNKASCTCSTHKRDEKFAQNCGRKTSGEDPLGRFTCRCEGNITIWSYINRIQTPLNCLAIESKGGFTWLRIWTFGFHGNDQFLKKSEIRKDIRQLCLYLWNEATDDVIAHSGTAVSCP